VSTAQPAKVDPYAAIPADGAHEKAAYAAVPAALRAVGQTTLQQSRPVVDTSRGKPTLVSYSLEARVGKRYVLFEVRGDGKAYELYRYPDAPDPKKLFWQDAAGTGSRLANPAGPGETAAADAVRAVMEAAAPGETAVVSIYDYDFYWLKADGTPVMATGGSPFRVSIDPQGDPESWSS
jgi:hypothetical protein